MERFCVSFVLGSLPLWHILRNNGWIVLKLNSACDAWILKLDHCQPEVCSCQHLASVPPRFLPPFVESRNRPWWCRFQKRSMCSHHDSSSLSVANIRPQRGVRQWKNSAGSKMRPLFNLAVCHLRGFLYVCSIFLFFSCTLRLLLTV